MSLLRHWCMVPDPIERKSQPCFVLSPSFTHNHLPNKPLQRSGALKAFCSHCCSVSLKCFFFFENRNFPVISVRSSSEQTLTAVFASSHWCQLGPKEHGSICNSFHIPSCAIILLMSVPIRYTWKAAQTDKYPRGRRTQTLPWFTTESC